MSDSRKLEEVAWRVLSSIESGDPEKIPGVLIAEGWALRAALEADEPVQRSPGGDVGNPDTAPPFAQVSARIQERVADKFADVPWALFPRTSFRRALVDSIAVEIAELARSKGIS